MHEIVCNKKLCDIMIRRIVSLENKELRPTISEGPPISSKFGHLSRKRQ